MERWGFYLSGIKFGILELDASGITHQILDVMTNTYEEKEALMI